MIKRTSILMTLITMTLAVFAQVNGNWSADNGNNTYNNPLLYGDWPDPDIIRVDDDFYFISTSMHFVPGSPIVKSKDLVNWEMAGYAVQRYDEDPRYDMQGGTLYLNGSWANTIRYNNGKFYVGFCTPWGQGIDKAHFSICTATDIKGPWTRKIFAEEMYDPGLLFDDDGKVYVAHGQGTIYVTELTADAQAVKTPKKQVFYNSAYGVLEGSHFYKINGMYYMISSQGGSKAVCLRSKNVYGPYESKVILEDKTSVPYATYPLHQGGIVQLKDGSWWMMIMQDYGAIGRTPNLEPVTWVNGWPMLGVNGLGVRTYTKPNTGKTYPITAPATTDEFNTSELGLQWQWNHNPDVNRYSLTERPGYMRLKASKAAELSLARNTLTQRVVGPNSTGTVLMDVRGMKDGNVAGFGVFQKPYAYVAVKQEGNVRKIVMNNNNTIVANVNNFAGDSIWFRAKATEKGALASFYYSTDGKKFNKLGNDLTMDLGYSWTANRFALFNLSTTDAGVGGCADFNWFHFSTDFVASATSIKTGDSISFYAGSICEKALTYQWSFPGGIPSESNLSKPGVKYLQPGVFSATLIVNDGEKSDTLVRTGYVTVEDTCCKPISPAGFKVKYVDSQQNTTDQAGKLTIDGNKSTFWHTSWDESKVPPHEIQIDLGNTYDVCKLKYLPRQDGQLNGTIGQYEVYVSLDGTNWGLAVAKGTLDYDNMEKTIPLAVTKARYVKLRALKEGAGKAFTSAAEITIGQMVNPPAGLEKRLGTITRIYPNPANSVLNVETFDSQSKNIRLYDVLGKKVLEQNYGGGQNKFQLDVSALNNGIYFLQLNGQTEKIILNR